MLRLLVLKKDQIVYFTVNKNIISSFLMLHQNVCFYEWDHDVTVILRSKVNTEITEKKTQKCQYQ